MSLKERINEDVKDAMRQKDKPRLNALRLITAAIKQVEVDKRIEMDDDAVIEVLTKMLKQRRESIEQYEKAGRDDLLQQEQFEVGVIEPYMPEQLGEDEIVKMIEQAIADTGASSMKEMGKVIGKLKPAMAGKADMGMVSKLVKEKLS
jgi:uncharacterized protein YqeY